jgi:serine/threonine protein kinase
VRSKYETALLLVVNIRLTRGPIPLDEALSIAKQIAEALEAAHEQGIIHRDLKPGNVKVRSDGTVKVLDFGLAKAMEPAAGSSPSVSMSPTITPAMTQAGMILGTAAYMSPEQAKGRPADKRSDIWAFGCVLYEMITGKPPRRRMFRNVDMDDSPALVAEQDQDEEHTAGQGRHGEEVHRHQRGDVIGEKSPPCL